MFIGVSPEIDNLNFASIMDRQIQTLNQNHLIPQVSVENLSMLMHLVKK